MRGQTLAGWSALAAIFVAQGAAAGPTRCPVCDQYIVISPEVVGCVQGRLADLLRTGRDPVVVSLVGCDDGESDASRVETLPGFRLQQRPAASSKRVYLLSRPDAACLSSRLKAWPHRGVALKTDLGSC